MQRTPLLIATAGFFLAIALVGWQVTREPDVVAPETISTTAAMTFERLDETAPVAVAPEMSPETPSREAPDEKKKPAATALPKKEEKVEPRTVPIEPEPAPPPKQAKEGQVSPPDAPPVFRKQDTAEQLGGPANEPFVDPEYASSDKEVADEATGPSGPSGLVIPPAAPRRIDGESATITVPSSPRRPVSAPVPKPRVLPEGTVLEIRLAEDISTKQNKTGDTFSVLLERDLEANGEVLLRKGSVLVGTIEEATAPGRVKGRAELSFFLSGISFDGQEYPIRTNTITMEAESTKGRDVATVGATTAIGAVLGGIFGGGKGAAIGGAAGAGAGAGGVLLGRGKHVELEKERLFSFRLEETVELSLP
jgi:hypothetical protein